MALSKVVNVEVNPADVPGARVRYKLGIAEFSIAMSALYQLLLLNPQRGCAILSGLREWERSRRLTDTWAANTPCWAALGELGWEGCSDKDILLSSCGMHPPIPASPRSASPAKPAPAEKPKPPAVAPPKPTPPKKTRPPKRKSFKSGSSLSSDQELPRPHAKGKGKQPRQQKRREEPPSLEGDESPDPLFGERVYVPYTDGVYPGVVTSVAAGRGGRVWVEHPGEKEMFRVESGVQPRKDGLGTPPFLGFFDSYTLRRHPKTLNTNTAASMRLLWGTLGPGLLMTNFGVFLETPFWARTPLGTPLPSQEGGFLGGFLGRNPPPPIPLPGQEPPFLDPSYDPSCPEAIAHKSGRWGLNRIVPPH